MTDIVLAVTINDANSVFPDKRHNQAALVTVLNRHSAARGAVGSGLYITPSAYRHPAFREMLNAVAPCFVTSGRSDILDYIRSEVEE